ncbi:MAG TPA: hypothetical protein VKQ30_21305 [Ktedonobacterales bacterium]|nr:hypothetical protein [Ktedonobacterales bacterium]
MPSVDDMFNRNILNVILDRALSVQSGIPTAVWSLLGIWMNFVRLTDKALREYDAARAELIAYVEQEGPWRLSRYHRAMDHLENCVNATHRAVLNAKALQRHGIGRSAPRLTERQERRLRLMRHAIEHADERLDPPSGSSWPTFQTGEPYALRLANRAMVIGGNDLTYRELVSAMNKMYRTIEAIRGPSVRPGDVWTNASLRTDPGPPPHTSQGNVLTLQPSEYMRALTRLMSSH